MAFQGPGGRPPFVRASARGDRPENGLGGGPDLLSRGGRRAGPPVSWGGPQRRGAAAVRAWADAVTPSAARILVVEDEDKLRRALQRGLAEAGHKVETAEDGEAGLALAGAEPFDLVVLDLMLPGLDGFGVLDRLRARGVATPVLILSARGELDDRVRGLDIGADDYLAKPFAWAELLARVRACLRRGERREGTVLRAAGVELDRLAHRLSFEGNHAELTLRECRLMEYLMRRVGQAVSREELARDVWNDPQAGLTNVIDVYVNYLRKKLERVGAPPLIRTVRGVGYEFEG